MSDKTFGTEMADAFGINAGEGNDALLAPKMEKKKRGRNTEDRAADAWINLELPLADGTSIKLGNRGIGIWLDDRFPDRGHKAILALAAKNDGRITLQINATVQVNTPQDDVDIDLIAMLPNKE